MKITCYKSKQNAYLTPCTDYTVSNDEGRESQVINVRPSIEYQVIDGFGGAFTEAASTTLDKLSKENKEKILKLYFDPKDGIGYNLGRVHINSCDFSLGNYTCVDEGDKTLKSFNIKRDKKSLIPMIKQAMQYNDIDMLASPWSPPAYMKTNGEMNHGGKLKQEYAELWAEYFVKFINAYKKEGIIISSVTAQNEPKATQTWDSCVYTEEEEYIFIKNHLGKKMKDLGVKLLFWDHNKERIIDRAQVSLGDKETYDYLEGVAFHWYTGDHFAELDAFHHLYPDKKLVFSEGCYEYYYGKIDNTIIGERYAHDMIGNFNNYCNAFYDWNLVLNDKGGPNHTGNLCDAPIMVDTDKQIIEIHPSYYYIGHFSKFIKKGAKRVASSSYTQDLETVSFKNPDNSVVSVVLNRTDKDIPFAFRINGKVVDTTQPARSISTFIFEE